MRPGDSSSLLASSAVPGATMPVQPSGLPCAPGAVDDFLSRPSAAVLETLARHPGPVLVLGAGGKIGLHLSAMVRQAFTIAGRRDPVIAVSRFSTLRDRAEFEARGISTMACDLADEGAVAALPDAPTIFFLAGVKFGTSSDPDILRRMNVDMPRLVAERYRKSRIVAFSTGCVYPFVRPESGGASESTPVDASAAAYAASCIERERAFAAVSAAHGTPVALIRLNYAVEFRYGLLLDIAQKVVEGRPVDAGMGYVNVIWQSDAVEHSIQSLDVAGAPALPVNVTGGEVLSVRQLALRFGELLGRPAIVTGEEAETAWLNDARWSHRRFGAPRTSLDEMMQWTAAWVREVGQTWGKPTGFERRDGRY
jgi:nucleoside-diphosphate-sugar epimerase